MVHACYGMHCPWEDSRGECRWHKGWPYPCDFEEEDKVDEEELLDDEEE